MNVLNTAESLLPEFELYSHVQLLETSVQMALKSVSVAQIDGVRLLLIFGSILQVVAEKLA